MTISASHQSVVGVVSVVLVHSPMDSTLEKTLVQVHQYHTISRG